MSDQKKTIVVKHDSFSFAHPIMHKGKSFFRFTNKTRLNPVDIDTKSVNGHEKWLYFKNIKAPETDKDPVNPQSEYHKWLKEHSTSLTYAELRKQWIQFETANVVTYNYQLDQTEQKTVSNLPNPDAESIRYFIDPARLEKKYIRSSLIDTFSPAELILLCNYCEALERKIMVNPLAERRRSRLKCVRYNLRAFNIRRLGDAAVAEANADVEEVTEDVEVPSDVEDSVIPDASAMPADVEVHAEAALASDEKLDYATDAEMETVFNVFSIYPWSDIDERKMTKNDVARFRNEVRNIFPIMVKIASSLERSISAVSGALSSMSVEEKNNFLFHVIAKGSNMFMGTIVDPEFCLYMLDQYQPLYTYMLPYVR